MSEPTIGNVLDAPCVFCDYNGRGYWQAHTHKKSCPWYEIGGGDERERNFKSVLRQLHSIMEVINVRYVCY